MSFTSQCISSVSQMQWLGAERIMTVTSQTRPFISVFRNQVNIIDWSMPTEIHGSYTEVLFIICNL